MQIKTGLILISMVLSTQCHVVSQESPEQLRLVRIEMDISGIGRFTYSGEISLVINSSCRFHLRRSQTLYVTYPSATLNRPSYRHASNRS